MIDVYIWIAVWVVLLIMLIISLTKIESRIAEDRINKMFEYLKKRKRERLAIVRCIDADKAKHDVLFLFSRNKELIDEWLVYCVDEVIDEQPTVDVVEQKDLDAITEAHERTGYDRGFRDGYAQAMEEAIKAVGLNTWAGSRITQLQPAKFRERGDDE